MLGMLSHVSGPNASGEYTARCPAHEDHTASLTVTEKASPKDGKRRIYMCCHAGCANQEIMARLGISARDLIVDPDPEGRPGSGKGRAGSGKPGAGAAKAQRKTRTTWGPPEVMMNPDGTVYRDEDGKAYYVRTVDEQGRPLDEESGEVIPGMAVDPKTGKLIPLRQEAAEPETGETVPGMAVHQAVETGPAKKDERVPDWDHPDRVYSYTDAEGRELFQVVRLHYRDGKPGKTFRQRARATEEQKRDGRTRITREGYVNSVPAEIRDGTLYRMPEVARAIAEGRPVYVVEGEKDADTLARLGFCATCNPGGAGKWREGHSRILAGADVIILPDCDGAGNGYTGQEHSWQVALQLRGTAKRVRLVDLKKACPEIPEKGDISDMVQIMGDVEAMDALARQVAATRTFDPQQVPFWLTPEEQAARLAARLYDTVRGYGAEGGCIVQKTADGAKALCDFTVIPRQELIRDDGVTQTLHFVLDGWNAAGQRLKRVTVSAADLDAMNWVTGQWGFSASLAPGSTTKGKVAWAIKKVGQMTAKQVTEYSHTGWRKIGGKYAFLYHGGAVGMEGVTVNLGDNALKNYRLDGSGAEGFDRIGFREAAEISLRVQKVMKEEIGTALLGTMYLAPLREFLQLTDVVPAFALFMYGKTGTHKSTAAALALSHFGNFHAKNPPASFSSTGNQIRTEAFLAKDVPLLVDDYHPTTSMQEKRQMAAIAQQLSRAFGDGSDRGRLNADRTIAASRPPRSVAVITGEDLPAIGASGLARFFILDIDEGDIPVGAEMTEMQELARKGYLQRAMRGYILWLSEQTAELPERLHDLFIRYRERVRKEGGAQHDRAPETIACILIGYTMMANYFRDVGLIDTEEAARMTVAAMRRLMDAASAQAKSMESEKPTRIFLEMTGEMLSSHAAMLKDLTAEKPRDPFPNEHMIGYMDRNYYYLLPNAAFGMVSRMCREQGVEFPVSLKALYKHLKTDGVLQISGDSNSVAKAMRIDGRVQRVLAIPQREMDGPAPENRQQEMTEVDGGGLPEEWK